MEMAIMGQRNIELASNKLLKHDHELNVAWLQQLCQNDLVYKVQRVPSEFQMYKYSTDVKALKIFWHPRLLLIHRHLNVVAGVDNFTCRHTFL